MQIDTQPRHVPTELLSPRTAAAMADGELMPRVQKARRVLAIQTEALEAALRGLTTQAVPNGNAVVTARKQLAQQVQREALAAMRSVEAALRAHTAERREEEGSLEAELAAAQRMRAVLEEELRLAREETQLAKEAGVEVEMEAGEHVSRAAAAEASATMLQEQVRRLEGELTRTKARHTAGSKELQARLEEARQEAILGSCARSWDYTVSGFRSYLKFAGQLLPLGASSLPPQSRVLLAWQGTFRSHGTCCNYLGHVKTACLVRGVSI